MELPIIEVGIKTSGPPIVRHLDNGVSIKNMLIGDGFHWQRKIEARLPGEIFPYNPSNISEVDRTITLINRLPLETYLECVVGSEMNPSAPLEFLKAHAVISRSWALGKIKDIHHRENSGKENSDHTLIGWDDTACHHGFHVCSDDHCQRYQGLQPISEKSLQAIRDTHNEILTTPEGHLLDARFSKCCGGQTEMFSTCWQPEKESCLESFKDPWCDLSLLTPASRRALLSSVLKDYDLFTEGYGYTWEAEISKKDVEKNLWDKFGRRVGEVQSLEPLHRGLSGRIDLLRVTGSEGYLNIGKELWIRRLLSHSHLYSSAFEIEDIGESFKFRGKGWGHGVGLCQIGAANMAFQGAGYREILSFYYPGSKINKYGNI